ncbi:hypothetical protein GCM10010112_59750 [Actinoplanes lobatus]|uniref:alpha-amylase n=1 Tax=Actinoplanes lobatus TaxID=113568 RepID=A0A7W7MM77_9ACTN|nr:hypothetical protein [Actinoplanes lobatus]MBB4755041.1 hypothetical protein [Actinoplanes lobatus]GGN82384.1 hypothetical protein GCM10010112_59750 [Actinoplanes lobatus]GIE40641.1 hypothetical protein Alo02nite_35390 [Actinoplanes lobatus]
MSIVFGRRALATVVASLLTGLSLIAGAAPAQASSTSFRTWVKDPGGRSLEGITVTLEPGGYQQVSGADGSAVFSGFPVGEYRVSATAVLNGDCPVAAGQTLLLDRYGLEFTLMMYTANGEECPPVVEEPLPATLGGLVMDHDGWQPADGGGIVTLQPGDLQTTISEFGWYEFPGLPAGDYTVTATTPGGACGFTATWNITMNGYDQTVDLYPQAATCP